MDVRVQLVVTPLHSGINTSFHHVFNILVQTWPPDMALSKAFHPGYPWLLCNSFDTSPLSLSGTRTLIPQSKQLLCTVSSFDLVL